MVPPVVSTTSRVPGSHPLGRARTGTPSALGLSLADNNCCRPTTIGASQRDVIEKSLRFSVGTKHALAGTN